MWLAFDWTATWIASFSNANQRENDQINPNIIQEHDMENYGQFNHLN